MLSGLSAKLKLNFPILVLLLLSSLMLQAIEVSWLFCRM